MGKGSKRRTGENTTDIVSNWDEIDWGLKDTKDKEADKKKDDRKRINDNES